MAAEIVMKSETTAGHGAKLRTKRSCTAQRDGEWML
jgi:hypothetical protein